MLRSTHILCPLDFSEFSRRTFERAVAIARVSGGSVTVLYVAATPRMSVMPYVGPEGLAPFPYPEIDRAKLTAEMKALLGGPQESGAPIAIEITEAPDVAREILAQAGRLRADLIVIGTHGQSGVERLLLGSVAEKVLRTAEVPVLTVPSGAPDLVGAPEAACRHIVSGVDFSDCSKTGLEYAAALAEAAGAELTVVHVVEVPPIAADPIVGVVLEAPDYRESLVREATRHLHEFVDARVGRRCVAKEIVAKGKASVEILRVASEERADLIVLGLHGRNVVDRLVFGSTTDRVIRQANCPVLTVRDARPRIRKAAS